MSRPTMPQEQRWLWWRELQAHIAVRCLGAPDARGHVRVVPAGDHKGCRQGRLVPLGRLLTDEDLQARLDETTRAVPAHPTPQLFETWCDNHDPFVGRVEIKMNGRVKMRCLRDPNRFRELPLSAWSEAGRMTKYGEAPKDQHHD